jgi:hypothetical protein
MTRLLAVATALAMTVAGRPAWGHRFPAVRTVVVQVESCEVVLFVGYRPGTGEATEAILARAATQPNHKLTTRSATCSPYAMAPLALEVDGKPVMPTVVRAKIGLEPGGARPMVVLLVSYSIQNGHTLALRSSDARTTRISWQDRGSHRVASNDAPAQGRWFTGVASFLLNLQSGGSACVGRHRHIYLRRRAERVLRRSVRSERACDRSERARAALHDAGARRSSVTSRPSK